MEAQTRTDLICIVHKIVHVVMILSGFHFVWRVDEEESQKGI